MQTRSLPYRTILKILSKYYYNFNVHVVTGLENNKSTTAKCCIQIKTADTNLVSAAGSAPASSDMMVDLPAPCKPTTPMTRKSVWSTNSYNM